VSIGAAFRLTKATEPERCPDAGAGSIRWGWTSRRHLRHLEKTQLRVEPKRSSRPDMRRALCFSTFKTQDGIDQMLEVRGPQAAVFGAWPMTKTARIWAWPGHERAAHCAPGSRSCGRGISSLIRSGSNRSPESGFSFSRRVTLSSGFSKSKNHAELADALGPQGHLAGASSPWRKALRRPLSLRQACKTRVDLPMPGSR